MKHFEIETEEKGSTLSLRIVSQSELVYRLTEERDRVGGLVFNGWLFKSVNCPELDYRQRIFFIRGRQGRKDSKWIHIPEALVSQDSISSLFKAIEEFQYFLSSQSLDEEFFNRREGLYLVH